MKKVLCVAVLLAMGGVGSHVDEASGNGGFSGGGLSPSTGTALGIPELGDYEGLSYGAGWTPPLGGYYYISIGIAPPPLGPLITWRITFVPPPEARDPMIGQGNIVALPPAAQDNQNQWAKIVGTQPGWVFVEALNKTQVVGSAYYALYEIKTLEDDIGGEQGFDPRYGAIHDMWFGDLGGYLFQNGIEGHADGLCNFDDRMDGGTFWTGMPLDPFDLSVLRSPVWLPEAQLDPIGAGQTPEMNSLVAVPRRDGLVRVRLHGPCEDKVQIPVMLHCAVLPSGGMTFPGVFSANDQDYDIIPPPFVPPVKSDPPPPTIPGNGQWGYATSGVASGAPGRGRSSTTR